MDDLALQTGRMVFEMNDPVQPHLDGIYVVSVHFFLPRDNNEPSIAFGNSSRFDRMDDTISLNGVGSGKEERIFLKSSFDKAWS